MGNIINIAFCDSDKEYIYNFNEFLKSYERKSFDINFFTDTSSLEEFCKNTVVDLVVIAEYLIPKLNNSDFLKIFVDRTVALGDEKEITHIDDFLAVYRYQRADELISDILNICAEKTANKEKNIRYLRGINTIVAGIFSPVSRCGKTRLSIELAKEIVKKDRRCLILNLEEFSVMNKYLGCDERQNISDLLFYYLGGKGCFEIKSEAIIKSFEGFDYVSPVECIYDLRNVESKVWISFISDLGKIRGYEVVIVDISCMVNDYFELMENMDIVFLPYLKDEFSRYKIESMKRFLNSSEHRDILDKFMELGMDGFLNDGNYYIVNESMIKLEKLIKEKNDCSRRTSKNSN